MKTILFGSATAYNSPSHHPPPNPLSQATHAGRSVSILDGRTGRRVVEVLTAVHSVPSLSGSLYCTTSAVVSVIGPSHSAGRTIAARQAAAEGTFHNAAASSGLAVAAGVGAMFVARARLEEEEVVLR